MRASLLALVAILGIGCVDKKKSDTDASVAPAASSASVAPKARLTVASCETILVEGEEQLAKERASADKTCAKDEDCVLVHSGVCAPSCTDYAMSKVASASYGQRRKQIDRAKCLGWRDSDCATI